MNPAQPRFKLLFLCTGNSARSILAEFLLRKIAPHKFEVVSAGASPKPHPHPLALSVLRDHYKLDVTSARSKSWDEFEGAEFDFVITLCDNARETCPVWPGQPILAHWPSPDPADTEGTDEAKAKAFWQVAQQIQRRLELLASLPFEKLDALKLAAATREIGQRERLVIDTQPAQPMKLSAFKAALDRHPDGNLAILLPSGNHVPEHFHITEVGRTEKDFVDCGGKTRHLAFASLQVWVADDTAHRLPAGKLAVIIEQAACLLGGDDPEMQVECQEGTIGLFSVESAAFLDGSLVFTLANKQTACLALEVCLPDATEESSCCGGSSCCG